MIGGGTREARLADAARQFTYRTARSGALVIGITMVVIVETIALHALLIRAHNWLAWTLTLFSVSALWWIASDYRAMATGAVQLGDETLELTIGKRFRAEILRRDIASATKPTWRERPAYARDYLNVTKPATPNVLLVLHNPATVRLPGGVRVRYARFGMHLDDPDAFLAALNVSAPG